MKDPLPRNLDALISSHLERAKRGCGPEASDAEMLKDARRRFEALRDAGDVIKGVLEECARLRTSSPDETWYSVLKATIDDLLADRGAAIEDLKRDCAGICTPGVRSLLHRARRIFPSKCREELLGDLREECSRMTWEGQPEAKVLRYLLRQIAWIAFERLCQASRIPRVLTLARSVFWR